MSLKWTTDKPTEPGWYWYHENGWRRNCVVMVSDPPNDLQKYGASLFADSINGRVFQFVAECNGQWAGPIPEPE